MKGLQDTKIESPNTLQKKIYKAVQTGSDLVINTTSEEKPEVGYLISLLNQIAQSDRRQGTRAIIITGDRIRARQLDEWIWAIGYHASIESACITQDGNRAEQKKLLSAGPVIVVATPTRFSELLEESRMVFREVEQFIVDQAETVTDWEAVDVVSKRIIGKCQRIFTASKDSKELREAEKNILEDPELVTLVKKETAEPASGKSPQAEEPAITKDLTQYYINVPPRSKISTLMAHLNRNQSDTVVIFTASRRTADRLYKIFRKSNKRAVSIHDQIDKDTFKERFDRFTSGNVQHLIVGELSAADIPLEHATQVINYDVPEEVEEYRLRADLVGTGKANKILSLVSKQDRSDIQTICKSLGYAPEEVPLPKVVKEGSKKSTAPSKKSTKAKPKPKPSGKPKKGGHGQKKQKRGAKGKRGPDLDSLPRPTFDQLEGGRSGKKKEKKGLVGLIKKLFS